MKYNSYLLFLVFLMTGSKPFLVQAQPVNDECAGAIQLGHSDWPIYYAASAADATPSMGGSTKDVWFTFTATSDLLFVRLTNSPMKYEVFSGSCGNLVPVNDEAPLGGFCADMPDSTPVNVGQAYYVRVYFTSTANDEQPFQICFLPRHIYDVCSTAPELAHNYDNIIDSLTFGSMMYGRVSSQAPIAYPFTTTGGTEDIWFKFIATGTAHTVFLGSVSYISCWTSSGYPYLYAMYDGCTPADTIGTQVSAPISFDTPGYVDFNSLTIGNTYYLRLWTNKSTGVSADFFAGVGPLGATGQMPPPMSAHSLAAGRKALIVSPNPVTTELKISLTSDLSDDMQVTIIDVTGKQMYSGTYTPNHTIDVRAYAAGVYFVRCTDKSGTISSKFLKQ